MKLIIASFISILLLSVAPSANSAICDFIQNAGKVKRIYPQQTVSGNSKMSGTYFTLSGTTAALTSPTNYYFIPNRDNYHEMHNLVLEAAKAGWTLQARTANCTTPVSEANVLYLVVDFP